jgi:hypothetical protein
VEPFEEGRNAFFFEAIDELIDGLGYSVIRTTNEKNPTGRI